MRVTRVFSYIDVVGPIWMPAVTCSMRYTVSKYDLDNMKDEEGKITRESVEDWLGCHTGDFQGIDDFYADLETEEGNVIFDWSTEDGESKYLDTLPEEY